MTEAKVGSVVWFRAARMYGHPEQEPVLSRITAVRPDGRVNLDLGIGDESLVTGEANGVNHRDRLQPGNLDGACWWEQIAPADERTPHEYSDKHFAARASRPVTSAKDATFVPRRYGPDNPPRLRRPGESIADYRIAMGWDPAPATVREFTNELGNSIRITIEGPTSVSENILTPMEVRELAAALNCHSATPAAQVPAWQPIETAPKDCVFLGWIRAERWSAADGEGSGLSHDVSQGDFCWWRAVLGSPDGGYWDTGAGQIGDAQEVTHWMPLPAAPAHAGERSDERSE